MKNKEYKNSLYKAQKTDDIEDLVRIFEKCQKRMDEKLEEYQDLLKQVKAEN